MTRPVCSVDECSTVVNAKGLCHKHYKRFRRYGDVTVNRNAARTDEQYIADNHEVEVNGCWVWTGAVFATGYGNAHRRGKTVSAHRLAYETWVGPIPEGLVVRHSCDNRPCINPDHLSQGTHKQNMEDKSRKDRNANTKLSTDDVIDIRWVHGLGASGQSIARAFGVSPTTVSTIVNNKSRRTALEH